MEYFATVLYRINLTQDFYKKKELPQFETALIIEIYINFLQISFYFELRKHGEYITHYTMN